MPNSDYTYEDAGFDGFLTRPLVGTSTENQGSVYQNRQVNFDQSQTSGALGDTFRVGRINLDGANGRISVFDENGNESVRIGELDD